MHDWLDDKMGGDRNSGLFLRPRGHRIKGTHTRFHAWNYTEFSKIISMYMLMTNIDQLFDIPDDFAAAPCSRPGDLIIANSAIKYLYRYAKKCRNEVSL